MVGEDSASLAERVQFVYQPVITDKTRGNDDNTIVFTIIQLRQVLNPFCNVVIAFVVGDCSPYNKAVQW